MAPHFARKHTPKTGLELYPESYGASTGSIDCSASAGALRGLRLRQAHRIRPGIGLLNVPACVDRQPLQEISAVAGALLRRI